MKVLFGVNNEDISESIVKKYQKNYKEIMRKKEFYFFIKIFYEEFYGKFGPRTNP